MRKRKSLFFAAMAILFLFLFAACEEKGNQNMNVALMTPDSGNRATTHIIDPDSEVRGVWIASVYNIDYPSQTDLSADVLKAEIDAILDTCERNSLNTVFFQVRPTCDALYKSEIFPVSANLSTSGTLVFDPLEYIVTEAHQRNIFVHAWVNPLRVTMSSHDTSALPDGSPAKEHPEWTVPYADGKLYLNAGLPEVRQLVADGVEEIVKNYDVDGIVFDDYFYPYPVNDDSGKQAEFDDADEYALYGSAFDNVADWRRNNINQLVELCYNTVRETDPECVFGISPFAVWQNNNGSNGGSNTTSLEAYHSLYCDALAWIRGGYIDYISPQVYWTFDTKAAPFDVVTRWWNAQLEGSDVKLYVSHASYRYEDGNWEDPQGELTEQVEFARSEKYYHGSIFYGYDEINRNINGASDDVKKAFEDEIIYTAIQSNGHGVTFSSPENGSTTTESSTYIIGMSDPYYMLTMDGERVGRTKSGFFSVYVTLEPGVNEFVFEQNGIRYLYTITSGTTTGQAEQAIEPEAADRVIDTLSVTGTYPSNAVTTSGTELWVSCVAAYNSKVSVDIGGVVTDLVPIETPKKTKTDDGYIAVIYGANAKLPEAADGEVLDAGKVQYTARHSSGTVTAEGINVRVLGENAKLAVRALEDYTHLKITESSSYYNDYTVQSAGMTDYVVSQRNGYYQLRMGGYIAEGDVEEVTYADALPAELSVIEAAAVENAGEVTEFQLMCADRPAYNGCIEEDGRFVVTFYNVDAVTAPEPEIGENPLIESCEVVRLETKVRYAFTLYDTRNFYGFDLRYEDGVVIMNLRNPVKLDLTAEKPLEGIRVILDAGHGGDEPGAAGAYISGGERIREKDLNLAITIETAFLLDALGAEVELTREADVTLSIYDRMDYLEESEPDLCISIHQNSIGYTTDATRVRGTLSLWCMDSGRLLSDCVGPAVASSLGRNFRGSNYQALAMCRNPKFPQTLIEVGFITSVEEYEQMINGSGIRKAAEGIRDGVLEYFKKQSEFYK